MSAASRPGLAGTATVARSDWPPQKAGVFASIAAKNHCAGMRVLHGVWAHLQMSQSCASARPNIADDLEDRIGMVGNDTRVLMTASHPILGFW